MKGALADMVGYIDNAFAKSVVTVEAAICLNMLGKAKGKV